MTPEEVAVALVTGLWKVPPSSIAPLVARVVAGWLRAA